MVRLYQVQVSGNCYKVRLALTQLGIPFEKVEMDLLGGEVRTAEFAKKNPIGRVPAVELEPGVFLGESNAILWHFAEGTHLVPADKLERSRMLQWMFYEQYSHEPYIAVARAWIAFKGIPPGKEAELKERQEKGYVALYAYTHVAAQGRFDLAPYPALIAWLERVRSQPKHIPIEA